MRASTGCIIFSAISWSPAEMNILVPWIRNVPSGWRTALVVSAPTSLPAPGSVSAMVPAHFPESMLGRYLSFCTCVPYSSTSVAAPSVRPGYMKQAKL